ncbi:MAG: hypothetical protein IPO08_24730 [Xanthomonadales bacterium]|nr:hypothetical protein [Xanthomonadales bacterium]
MSDERITSLEREVTDLRVANAKLASSIEHLVKAVDELALVVQQQRDTMNQGRGILVTLMFVSGSIGAIVATLIKKMFGG